MCSSISESESPVPRYRPEKRSFQGFKKKYFCNHLFLLFLGLRAVRRSIKSSFRTIVSLSCSENLSRVDHHRKVDKAELLLDGELRVTGDDSRVRVETLG